MSKVTLKVEIDEEAYKQIKGDSVCSNNNESIVSKSSSAYYALNAIINATTLTECDDTVSRGVFEQVMWERDTAIEQLRKLGYELGQKIEPCDDCVSRSAVLEIFGYVMDYWKEHAIDVEPHEIKDALIKQYEFTAKQLSDLPPVTPKREQGEWIFEEVGVRTQVLKCSKCGTIIQRGENFTQKEFRDYINDILREKCITLDNFCHNCGAEMR